MRNPTLNPQLPISDLDVADFVNAENLRLNDFPRQLPPLADAGCTVRLDAKAIRRELADTASPWTVALMGVLGLCAGLLLGLQF